MVLSTITSALDGFAEVALGLCVVTENAFGVGITAVPTPLTDIGWDGWLWHWAGSVYGPSTTVTNAEGSANVRIPIDSKAMRKFKETDVMLAVLEVSAEVGAAVLTAKMVTRVLVKVS